MRSVLTRSWQTAHPTCASSVRELELALGSRCTSSLSMVSPRSAGIGPEGKHRHISPEYGAHMLVAKLLSYLQAKDIFLFNPIIDTCTEIFSSLVLVHVLVFYLLWQYPITLTSSDQRHASCTHTFILSLVNLNELQSYFFLCVVKKQTKTKKKT